MSDQVASSSEETESIQLQFRSGDDLFNNYGISIIKQVVDKSELTIIEKKEEMRKLVGSKYLDMLKVSESIQNMNNEFGDIISCVNKIGSISSSIDSNYSYNDGSVTLMEMNGTLFPEQLWELFDKSQFLELAKWMKEYAKKTSGVYYVDDGVLLELPWITSAKCVEMLLTTSLPLDICIEYYCSYSILQQFNPAIQTPMAILAQFLQDCTICIEKRMEGKSIKAVLEGIKGIYQTLHLLIQVMTVEKEYDTLRMIVKEYDSNWREEMRNEIAEEMKQWLDGIIATVASECSEVIKSSRDIGDLAGMKREYKTLSEEIESPWKQVLKALHYGERDPIMELFAGLFKDQSCGLITFCFKQVKEGLQSCIHSITTSKYEEYMNAKRNAIVESNTSSMLIQPIEQLFLDLNDLEYTSSTELIAIVEKEAESLYTSLIATIASVQSASPTPSVPLVLSYVMFVLVKSSEGLEAKYHLHIEECIGEMQAKYVQCCKEWITIQLSPEAEIGDYYMKIPWNRRKWYDCVSGWREYTLVTENEEGENVEEVILVPGSTVPLLTQLIIHYCKLQDTMMLISANKEYQSTANSHFVISFYSSLAAYYERSIHEVLTANTSIASPGLLLLLFDIQFVRKMVEGMVATTPDLNDAKQALIRVEEEVIAAIDPVDWTLDESYMKMAEDDYMASMALLISPLLPAKYSFNEAKVSKSLSRNTNVLFTPVEKIAAYPIATQSIPALLQSQIKGI